MLATSLLPLGVLRYLKRKTGHQIAVWKWILGVFLFEFSFAPYALLVSAIDAIDGWLNLTYFLLVWMLFFVVRRLLPARISVAALVVLGFMLMEPATSFITISSGHIAFSHSQVVDLSPRGNDPIWRFLKILYGMVWTVFPLLGVHYLINSIEKKIESVSTD